jgi:hypothetical protein
MVDILTAVLSDGLPAVAPMPALGPFLWGGHYAALKQRDRNG